MNRDTSLIPHVLESHKRRGALRARPARLKLAVLGLVTAVAVALFPAPVRASDLSAGCTQTSGDDVTLSNPGGAVAFDGAGVDGYADDASQTARARARAAYADLAASEDCVIRLSFSNTLTVGPGTTGLANGDRVRLTVILELDGTLLTAPPSSSGGSLAEMTAEYHVSEPGSGPSPLFSEDEDGEGGGSVTVVNFDARFQQQHYASGTTNRYLTERWDLATNVGDPQWRDEYEEDFRPGEVSAAFDIGSLTATFETSVGAELTIWGYLSALASAYGSGAVAESDFFNTLAAQIVPGPGLEGLQLVYGGPVEPEDTTPPVLTVPGTIAVDADSPQGAEVSYEVSANDDTDPSPVVSCDPPSGSVFPIGTTTVTCTATDAAGNTSDPQSFDVVVKGAAEQLGDLKVVVENFELNGGITTSLVAKLDAALASLNDGDATTACAGVQSFRNQVRALSGKKLTADQAQQLTQAATRIQAVLACS